MEIWLIVFECRQIVGPLVDNHSSNLLLTTHGLDGDNRIPHINDFEQLTAIERATQRLAIDGHDLPGQLLVQLG